MILFTGFIAHSSNYMQNPFTLQDHRYLECILLSIYSNPSFG
jgi:hypothetical protein